MTDDDGDAEGVLLQLDAILAGADQTRPVWTDEGEFLPDYDLARELLGVPVSQGYAKKQQSGRVAKALDAWIAHELRRAGFPDNAVWPRAKEPRVLPADVAPIEDAIAVALGRLDAFDTALAKYGEKAAKKGYTKAPPSLRNLRASVASVLKVGKGKPLPGEANAHILGRFYVKQVDVVVSSWQHGPDVLVSTKTQFSSYANNKNNRYEEAVGEVTNLRDRHPMAAMGFVYIVRTNIYDEKEGGAFAYLRDLLVRLRKPDGAFDATMLLVADWADDDVAVKDVRSATPLLSAERFFTDLIRAVTTNTPVDLHRGVRDLLPEPKPPGGLPPEDFAMEDDTALPEEELPGPADLATPTAPASRLALEELRGDGDR